MRANVSELKEAVKNNAVMLALCEHLANRERTRHNTTVPRAIRVLKLKGINVTKQQIVASFERLSTLGVGHVTLSRGRVSAIEWNYDPRQVGKVALGMAGKLEEVHPAPRIHLHKVAVKRNPIGATLPGSIIVKSGPITVEIPANTEMSRVESIINSVKGA